MAFLRAARFSSGAVAFAAVGVYAVPSECRTPQKQLAVEVLRDELRSVDRDLKNWFLTRKVALEVPDPQRHRGLHALFTKHNFVGLSINSTSLDDAERVMWGDLVYGQPKLEDSLSTDAREMKADMYLKMFREAADLENPARVPGAKYLRCLQEHFRETHEKRSALCRTAFEEFESVRRELRQQQATALEEALTKQHAEDLRAKDLFERRLYLQEVIAEAEKMNANASS